MEFMNQYKLSINGFENLLVFANNRYSAGADKSGEIYNTVIKQWPNSLARAVAILKSCGYESAKEYFVCFCTEIYRQKIRYTGQWDIMDDSEKLCRYCSSKGTIPYYYMGLKLKVKNWFKN